MIFSRLMSSRSLQAFSDTDEKHFLTTMRGFSKLLEGIVKYSLFDKQHTMFQLKVCGNKPNPLSMIFGCMDSRVFPSRYTNSDLGDNYIVRNAGNFVPYPDDLNQIGNITSAAGALELTCVRNNMKHVVVAGHSDCKAMGLLFDLRSEIDVPTGSPLELWIKKHGKRTLEKFSYLTEANNFTGPVPFTQESLEDKKFEIKIDPEQNFYIVDKLSQVNCIQQLENISAYPFLKERLNKNKLFLHALWYDVNSGNVYMLSKTQQKFVEINESSFFSLIEEVQTEEAEAG
ncbi:beta carbonic anhydrase 1-like [Ruditapes philippinarum]|uniref:beta carbonic anhydrase 1-like n=1 Tax=Ruditapes philippinarum TaxID=129788 RepID=UPI00295AC299|nr:beta carbonic anhydrase 1-like [Ruditapes philippinarum]